MATFIVSFAFGMIASQVYETHLTWWAYIIAILIGVFLIIPVGMYMIVCMCPRHCATC